MIEKIGKALAHFIAEIRYETRAENLTATIDDADPAAFQCARAGMVAVALCMPVLLILNLDRGTATAIELFFFGLKYAAFALVLALVLVFQKYRFCLLLGYLAIYIFALIAWVNSLIHASPVDDHINYYIWLPVIGSTYIAAVGIFTYFPLLTGAIITCHAVLLYAFSFAMDETAVEQLPAFAFFAVYWFSVMMFLLLTRRSFLRLSFEVDMRATREAKLLQTRSLLDIALKETRLGLIGFDPLGACVIKSGYFPLTNLDCLEAMGRGAQSYFCNLLKSKYEVDFAELSRTPLQITEDGSHFSIDLYEGDAMQVYTSVDVTEREKWEEQIRSAQKLSLIGQLTSGIAHDYNNILAIVRSNIEAFPKAQFGQLHEQYVAPAINALDHANSVSHKLLTLAGQRAHDESYIEVASELRESKNLFQSAIGAAIDFELDLDEGGYVVIDAEELRMALLNMLINSKNALSGRNDGRISLIARNTEEWIRIVVEDNGPGFDNELSERIFDPFFSTKSGQYSAGLGLSMVRGFVRQSGGSVRASSKDGITRFIIELPRLKNLTRIQKTQSPVVELPAKSAPVREKILIVDDNIKLLKAQKRLFEYRGLICVAAHSGEMALEIAKSNLDISIVLLDYSMPDLNGVELGQKIMKILPDARFYILTGEVPDAIQEKPKSRGFQDIICKPVKIDELLDMLAVDHQSFDQSHDEAGAQTSSNKGA